MRWVGGSTGRVVWMRDVVDHLWTQCLLQEALAAACSSASSTRSTHAMADEPACYAGMPWSCTSSQRRCIPQTEVLAIIPSISLAIAVQAPGLRPWCYRSWREWLPSVLPCPARQAFLWYQYM